MIPLSDEPLDLPFEPLTSGAAENGHRIQISASNGFGAGALIGVPQDVRITLNVTPQTGSSCFGLRIRSSGSYRESCELRFEPSMQRIQFRVSHQGRMGTASDAAITDVAGLDRPFAVDIVLNNDIVDASGEVVWYTTRCYQAARQLRKQLPEVFIWAE